ncbi:GNAT family N-acetyltransferase [Pseudescherichia vulneris]|uniref:GNAT family N-acetyltransferase n=1 Tax=Pseudescherichia vulneris TaxID=566 RepID=UPI0028AAD1EA|nr:GNAT family N-acetyltransferase [Pseudescherichia vulneris]
MMITMLTLTTPRLTLSPFQESDWPFFLRLRRDPAIMRFMADIASQQDIRRVFDARLIDAGAFVIRQQGTGAPLGDIGLSRSGENPQEADVGYSIATYAQGQGYASEALRALCHYAFNEAGVTALNAWVLAGNVGSQRVLEKLGFCRVEILQKVYRLNGVFHDDWVYRLTDQAFSSALPG